MKKLIIAAIVGACSLTALTKPAAACPAGYERVWIQGWSICKIKTPNLPLKAKS